MKLVTFTSAAAQRIGVVDTKRKLIVDLQAAHAALRGHETPAFSNMLALIDAGDDALRVADELGAQVLAGDVSAAQVPYRTSELLAPLPVPRQMRDCLAFELHYAQARRQALRVRAATYPDPLAAEIVLRDSEEFKIPAV
jgi:hypothetical protein